MGVVHLLQLVYWLVVIQRSLSVSKSSFMRTKAGCPGRCGNVRVPYPFGIGPKCSLPGFDLYCNASTDQHQLFLQSSYRVANISKSQIRIKNPIYSNRCADNRYAPTNMTTMDFTGSPYTLSKSNSFTQVGCTDLTVLEGSDARRNKFLRGCVTFCSTNNFSIANASCPGNACCQIQVPKGTAFLNFSVSALQNNWATAYNASCSYSFLGERDDSTSHAVFQLYQKGVRRYTWMKNRTVVLDWRIGTTTCTDGSVSACLNNSRCVNATAGMGGYRCSCSPGYDGNPYLPPGCQGSHLLFSSLSIISFSMAKPV